MKTVHALIIAIDNYPIPAHRLNGCCNDASAFAEYMAQYAKANGLNYREKRLFDADATRQNIVTNFGHYKAAQNDDVCVLYYSGHGSQMPAAPEFWDEQDGKSETFVCYDSRLPNNRDMIDKEMATLLWLATKDKDVHFLAVMDCCHSGSNTRDIKNVKARKTQDDCTFTPRDISEFFGKEHWKNGQPPSARHIHLAAAKDSQTAKELDIDGTKRGAFTYNLIKTLTETGASLSYEELIARVSQRVQNLVEQQNPQCDAYKVPADVGLTFMGASTKKGEFLVSWDKAEGWIVNVGGVQGLPASGASFALGSGREVQTTSVQANYSKVEGMNTTDLQTNQYKATLKSMGERTVNLPRLKVSISKDSEKKGVDILNAEIVKNKPQNIEFVADAKNAEYLVRAKDNSYRLTRREDITAEFPVFKRVDDYNVMSANAFLSNMDSVAIWQAKLMMDNPLTAIQNGEFELIILDGAGKPFKASDTSKDRTRSLTQYELKQPAPNKEVVLQLGIKNKGMRKYWVSGVYFGSDFGISNEFMPKKEIGSGETAWIEFENSKQIPFMVQEQYLTWGIREINEYFKFFISTDPINTSIHNQEALSLDEKETNRGIQRSSSSSSIAMTDWRTLLVPIKIIA
jgi:Caspase domain